MSELEQALAAVEAGEKKLAYTLLARLIKKEPEHVAAWYTLSTLVDDEQKEQTFLQKVLALEPNHEAAQHRLAVLNGEAPASGSADTVMSAMPVSPGDSTTDFETQAAGDTIPDWLMGEDTTMVAAPAVTTPAAEEAEEAEELPDWLREAEADPWAEAEGESEPEPAASVETPRPARARRKKAAGASSAFWDLLLYGLIGVAIILVLLLVYLII